MTYICVVNTYSKRFFNGLYKDILLSEDKEILENTAKGLVFYNANKEVSDIVEMDRPIPEIANELRDKLIAAGYKVTYFDTMFTGDYDNNIFKIEVVETKKVKEN